MKQFSAVFKFEYLNLITNKIFIILTAVLLAIITLVTFFPRFEAETDISLNLGDSTPKPLLIIDNSGVKGLADSLKTALTDYEVSIGNQSSDTDIEALVREGKYEIAIVIDSPLEYKYVVNNLELYDTTAYIVDEVLISAYKSNYLANAGLSQKQIAEFSNSTVQSESVIVGQDQTQSFFHAYLLMMGLYMVVLVYGQLVAQSVATEKSSRAMELLITSAKPKSLIFGKVIGTGAAGLTQVSVLLLWGVVCVAVNKKYIAANEILSMFANISPSLIIYTVIFFILGFALYAFLMGAMGSLASKLEEVGTLTMPVMFIFILSFIVTISMLSSGNIDNIVVDVLSYIPFTSPMAMFARICMGTANNIEAIISVIILIASTFVIGNLAVAIYKIGILLYGKPPKMNELIRALRKKK